MGLRAGMQQLEMLPVPADLGVEAIVADGIFCDELTPAGSLDAGLILYVHGGAYVAGSARTHRELAGRLGATANVRVVSIDYRLAPEFPFPAAVNDVMRVYRWALAEGHAADSIGLAGDSAGGGLVLAALACLRDAGDPLPAAAVCFSPWTDLAATGASMTANASTDPMLSGPSLQNAAALYLAGAAPNDPRASPLYADLTGLPPLLIQATDTEILFDDARRVAERARQAGVSVTFETWDDLIHVWQVFGPMLAEGREATEAAGRFLAGHLGRNVLDSMESRR